MFHANASGRDLRALDDVSLTIRRGETMGLVGESGSGKSTLGRCIVGLYRPTAGRIRFDGAEIAGLNETGRRPYRRRIQMIFQDPYGALNPRMTAGAAVSEHLRAQRFGGGDEVRRRDIGNPRSRRFAGDHQGPLSARAVRRAAAAGGDRARDEHASGFRGRRRAGVGARCLDPRAGDQSAAGAARAAAADLSVHLARPQHHRPCVRSGWR